MSRRKKLMGDLEAVQAEYNKKGSFIKDIRLEDESLFFTYESGVKNQREEFILQLNDYPDNSLLFHGNDSKMCTGNLQSIFKDAVKECNTKFKVTALKASVGSQEDDDDEEFEDDDDMGRGNLNASAEIDMEDDLKDVYDQEMSYKDHEDLTLEMKNYKAIFGDVVTRPMPLLETVDVEMQIPYKDILDESVCNAWGIDPKVPILCKMTFSSDYYLEAQREPKNGIFPI